jgi:hypothetical protein
MPPPNFIGGVHHEGNSHPGSPGHRVRPGQQITVSCTTNDMGEIDSISDLKFEAASGSTATPPPPSH